MSSGGSSGGRYSGSYGLPPELDPRGRGRRNRRSRGRSSVRRDSFHGLRLGLQIVAALLSFLIVIGSGWAWATYRNFSANITRLNAISNTDRSKAATHRQVARA